MRAPRTLASLAIDYNGFEAAGGQLLKAKFYSNVIWRPILPIPISHVIIPILHLDLGIFTWLSEALMKDLQELDAQLAIKCEPLTAADATAFQKLCELNGQLRSEEVAANTVQAQREGIVQQLQFVALHLQQHPEQHVMEVINDLQQHPEQHVMEVINDLQQAYRAADQQHNVHIARLQQHVMKASGSKDLKGPCSSAVEPVLQQYKIERQVYHGGAFIGNHVHRALKPTMVTAIQCRSHIPVIEDRCASLLPVANRIASRYEKLLNGYAACRAIFSHRESIGDESLERLQSEIEEFLKTCREEIVARRLGNIRPKLHLLEEHTVPLIRKLHVGLGLLAEQGAESLHSNLNTLNVIFKNIPNSLARLRTVAEQHLLTTTTEASRPSTLSPSSRKRKAEHQAAGPY